MTTTLGNGKCRGRGIDPISASLDQQIEFLTKIFESGVGYSSVGTVRSALSSVLIMENRISFGKHPLFQRFIKLIFNLRPVFPRQFAVWDPDIVLDYLRNLEYVLPLNRFIRKISYFIVFVVCTKRPNCEGIEY